MPNAGQSSSPIALTASYNLTSSPSHPAAAIQLADSLSSLNDLIGALAKFVMHSATDSLAAAAAFNNATGARSPIANASPV